jgi:two-component sensor histidine kinase
LDHDILQRRHLRLVRALVWAASALLYFLLHISAGMASWGIIHVYALTGLLGFFISGLVLSATERAWRASGWNRFVFLMLAVIMLSALQSVIDTPMEYLAENPARYIASWQDDFSGTFRQVILLSGQTFVFTVWIHAFFATYAWTMFRTRELVDQERRLAAAESLAQTATLSALRAQVNPHFLFNALNAIASLISSGRAPEAEEALLRLSDFFRASLSAERQQTVSVADELEMLDAYLEMEQLRFPDRLNVSIDMEEESAGAFMPSFLLQPLVENAIKYAVAPSTTPIHVAISARAERGILILMVEDDGETEPRKCDFGEGVGLVNVSNRIEVLYGKAGEMTITKGSPGFRVMIKLPLSNTRKMEIQ